MDRKLLESRYNHLYKRIKSIDSDNENDCFYCGSLRDVYDHSSPLIVIESIHDFYHKNEYYLVPSCTYCNSLLQGSNTLSLYERAILAKERLFKKRKKIIISGLKWEFEEIYKLKGMLLTEVIKMKYLSYILIKKLNFQHFMFYIKGDETKKSFFIANTSKKYEHLKEIIKHENEEKYINMFRTYIFNKIVF